MKTLGKYVKINFKYNLLQMLTWWHTWPLRLLYVVNILYINKIFYNQNASEFVVFQICLELNNILGNK